MHRPLPPDVQYAVQVQRSFGWAIESDRFVRRETVAVAARFIARKLRLPVRIVTIWNPV